MDSMRDKVYVPENGVIIKSFLTMKQEPMKNILSQTKEENPRKEEHNNFQKTDRSPYILNPSFVVVKQQKIGHKENVIPNTIAQFLKSIIFEHSWRFLEDPVR